MSLFKIFGISDFELIGMGDDDEDDDVFPPIINQPETENPMPVMSSLNTMSENGLFTGVFPPRKQIQKIDIIEALNATSLSGNTFAYNMSCPECDDNDFREVYFLLSNDYAQLLRDFQASIGLRSALTGQVCRSYGFHSMDQVPMPSYAGLRLIEFYATLFGANRIMALCNVMEIQTGHGLMRADPQDLVMPPPPSGIVVPVPNDDATKIDDSKDTKVENAINSSANGDKVGSGGADEHLKTDSTTSQDKKVDNDKVAPTKVRPDADSKISAGAIQSNGNGNANVKIDPTPASDQQQAKPVSQPSVPKDKVVTKTGDSPVKDKVDEAAAAGGVAPAAKVNIPAGGGGSDLLSNNNVQSGGHKAESVWQKLSHKIKALERNVSLSGGYLEQLSVQYKKQIEDLQLAVRQSGEALAAASKARELDRVQIGQLQEQIGQLTIVVEEVSNRMETMGTWVNNMAVTHLVPKLLDPQKFGLQSLVSQTFWSPDIWSPNIRSLDV